VVAFPIGKPRSLTSLAAAQTPRSDGQSVWLLSFVSFGIVLQLTACDRPRSGPISTRSELPGPHDETVEPDAATQTQPRGSESGATTGVAPLRDAGVSQEPIETIFQDTESPSALVPEVQPGECAIVEEKRGDYVRWSICKGDCPPRFGTMSCCSDEVCQGTCTGDGGCTCGETLGGCKEPYPICWPLGEQHGWACGTWAPR
jgi:hypothetical protein